MPNVVTATAPAKLNLALAVGPRDADGMHPICSWMVTVDLFDELEVRRLEADRFSRYAILWHEHALRPSDVDWSITRDLAVRAHRALEEHAGRRLPVQLKLEKRIPVGGGLGGGSSDAAAMLHAVNRLYDLGLDVAELARIGADLGADVPFLVHGGSALVEGIGDVVTPHGHDPELHAVVVLVPGHCATGRVYELFDEDPATALRAEDVRALSTTPPGPAGSLRDVLFNDLSAAARRALPRLEDDLARVAAIAECPALLAGSGSSLFVVCDDAVHAEHLAREITERSGLDAVPVRTTPSHARRSPVCEGT